MKKSRVIPYNYSLVAMITIFISLFLFQTNLAIGQSEQSKIISSLKADNYIIKEVIYTKLQKKYASSFYYDFIKNNSYKIIAFSEDHYVKDLDLFISDNADNLIKQDMHYHKQATLVFNPYKTSEFQIKIKNHDSLSETELYSCCVIIACKNNK